MTGLGGRFAAALTANAGRAHGPLGPDDAAALAVELAGDLAAGRPVAMSTGDALVAELGLAARFVAAGIAVLTPDDPGWPDGIAFAGVGVTGAALGLAATGTVAVPCGVGSPRSTSLVPPAHVCLVREADLVEDLAAALGRLATMPSSLAWISGPSRSADIEMTLTLGVHGPGRVDVIVVGGPELVPPRQVPGDGEAN